jgi:hypothetical protein
MGRDRPGDELSGYEGARPVRGAGADVPGRVGAVTTSLLGVTLVRRLSAKRVVLMGIGERSRPPGTPRRPCAWGCSWCSQWWSSCLPGVVSPTRGDGRGGGSSCPTEDALTTAKRSRVRQPAVNEEVQNCPRVGLDDRGRVPEEL